MLSSFGLRFSKIIILLNIFPVKKYTRRPALLRHKQMTVTCAATVI